MHFNDNFKIPNFKVEPCSCADLQGKTQTIYYQINRQAKQSTNVYL